ncbi:MAG: 4-deoxy-4-formamido-L-arabinose-phosphoundecaprenol deformylase [Gammaproteobacteria bacterium]|nr:4-deoxy-4-formamido-L-arabinose-phosphoundecaprenol deformylase [Gammaproteobacteria bacterium]MDE1887928.1 4-deoxy-4-formamido-L-arabinose-phosphoundecaprenol deformylase [Gammaproteobacteria bacterium]MDE2024171.1 4-deoxy-4-formamido-L-arabinose-phosphoundecaprenol deformylase [Gammaproteobacteria bacterium]MDE2139288.1 4-deoxy-4-formamido-L-arabinose-phosphoundecaprenol deformylase [Gammaproteobacteria bacterium]MDE2272616.1 4-deoxy-4-formamido-L-arabinose-phosphoundecaprenol deformylase 
MKQLALKIDVDTLRGTLEGVPALVSVLQKHGAQATFLFSLGPDNTGRALRRIFRPGFLKKVFRTNVAGNYGLKTLMYGTLIPGPDIGVQGAGTMRAVRDAGFEVGIHTWDHIRWQDFVARRDAEWTAREFSKAVARFGQVFGTAPKTFGAAGWQINPHVLALQEQFRFDYASDTRGTDPFLPRMGGRTFSVPQLPTSLPTLDELVGTGGIKVENVADHLLTLTERAPAHGHVYTLHAELEGMALMPVFEKLLSGWKAQGYELVATRDIAAKLDRKTLPVHEVVMGEIPGRSGTLALQGPLITPASV